MHVPADIKPSVLILCYQFPPVNGTGARRPYYLARQLADEGHRVSILTTAIEEHQPWMPNVEGVAVYRTPVTRVQRDTNRLQRGLAKIYWRLAGKPGHGLVRILADLLLPEGHIDRWDILPQEVEDLLGVHQIVLATCPSWYPFRLAARLSKKWNAMFIADYRDPWTVHVPTLHLGGFTRFGTGLPGFLRTAKMRRAERHWPGKAFAVTAISRPLLDNAIIATGVSRSMVVHGGYDPWLKPIPFVRNDRFTMVYTGRVYAQQDWGAVLDAIGRLHEADPLLKNKFRLRLYGAVSTDRDLLLRIRAMANATGAIEMMQRHGREETLKAQQSADAVLHISPDEHQGGLPVKFLEYLGCGRPIVLLIKKPDLEADVVQRTRTGICVSDATGLAALLGERLNDWENGQKWRLQPDQAELSIFDYSHQMRKWTAGLRQWFTEFQQNRS